MTARIARKEFTSMVRDGRFRSAGLLVAMLLVTALLLGWNQYRDLRRQHEQARAGTRQHWLTQGKKNPHSAAHYGVYAFQPKSPLALVDTGTDPYTGVAVWLEAHKQNAFKYRPAQDGTILARFGELTAATVLQLLVPLLIILLAFGAFAGERETGTLRQLLSLGVDPRHLAAGKALGIAAAMALLLVPAAAAGALALSLASENGAFAATLPRLALLALVYLLYFFTLLAVSLAVSASARTSRMALVGLLGFWIFNCLVAPRAAADLSKRLSPTPSAFQFAQAVAHDLKNGADGHAPPDARAERLKRQVLQQYRVSDLKALPVNFTGISLQASEEEGNLVFDKHYGRLWNSFDRQNRLQQWAGVLAPLLPVRALSMGLAGTDFAQHRHFAEAAEKYRRYFIQVMNEDIVHNAAGKTVYLREGDLWKQVKDFDYQAPDLGWVVRNHIAGLGLLAAWLAAAAALAWRSILRLTVD